MPLGKKDHTTTRKLQSCFEKNYKTVGNIEYCKNQNTETTELR